MKRKPFTRATTAALLVAGIGAVAVGATSSEALADIERYCTASWRQAGIQHQDWTDCTQETIVELLGRIDRDRLGFALEQGTEERIELQRSIWCVAQRWRRAAQRRFHLSEIEEQGLPSRDRSPEWELDARDELRDRLAGLKPDERRILELWSEGHKISDAAATMGLSPARASDLKYRAMKKLKG